MKARLTGVDATRGIALLGMMAVHSLYESDGQGNPTWSFAVFGGRAAATFAVLAGVGIAFLTGRRRVRVADGLPTAAALVARAVTILAIGLALGYTDSSLGAVILPYYAVMFLLAIPVVFLPTWAVAVTGGLLAGGVPVLSHFALARLPPATLDNPTLGYLLHDPVGLLSELSLTGEYPALPWMTYLCAGIFVGRLTLARVRVAAWLVAGGSALAVAAITASWVLLHHYGGLTQIQATIPQSILTGPETQEVLALGGDGTVPTVSWWWLAVDSPHTSTPPDLLSTIGTAVALLGLMLLAGQVTAKWPRRIIGVVQKPLAAAGSMTLTLYTAHIMFINSAYDVYGPGTGYVVQAVAVLLIGLGWRATAGRGPLEALVSAVSSRARRWAGNGMRLPRLRRAPAGEGA
ncbi:heparan-alpha-glucosaminide N-acetyltransferase domain-containing protein [Amycolatopsis jiangsuensis]|uniref:Putative membrane protein n=1 Tax=Amycolatopsis jiangsuensis TaxID=1181879 RepID=A0A840IPF1_9PSEU|nr:heparan-alpha-glucosaminide N-acetyltransferase domain-containing protein [Amycolatopsis jiangsuensis]MBB4683439.1 putative membrane protein [Amycolatopsis jiangsuensis]